MENILIIEDDLRLAEMLSLYLEQYNFNVNYFLDAKSGLNYLQNQNKVDLLILDLMLPDIDGLEVCKKVRSLPEKINKIPILILTAKGDPMDKIIGLEVGADDYLSKPFEPRELLARIKAILRRFSNQNSQNNELDIMRFGSLEINKNTRTLRLNKKLLELSNYQFELLLNLANNAGKVLTREQIIENVKGREMEAFDRSIDVHIGKIRALIETDLKAPKRILTVRGIGYVFNKQQD